jgi:hypothetical protein
MWPPRRVIQLTVVGFDPAEIRHERLRQSTDSQNEKLCGYVATSIGLDPPQSRLLVESGRLDCRSESDVSVQLYPIRDEAQVLEDLFLFGIPFAVFPVLV